MAVKDKDTTDRWRFRAVGRVPTLFTSTSSTSPCQQQNTHLDGPLAEGNLCPRGSRSKGVEKDAVNEPLPFCNLQVPLKNSNGVSAKLSLTKRLMTRPISELEKFMQVHQWHMGCLWKT